MFILEANKLKFELIKYIIDNLDENYNYDQLKDEYIDIDFPKECIPKFELFARINNKQDNDNKEIANSRTNLKINTNNDKNKNRKQENIRLDQELSRIFSALYLKYIDWKHATWQV